MANGKKEISTNATAISSSTVKAEQETPKAATIKRGESSKKGVKSWETRRTYIVNEDIANDLDAIAYWERKTIKDVVNKALRNVNEFALDSKNKEYVLPAMRVKPIPKK